MKLRNELTVVVAEVQVQMYAGHTGEAPDSKGYSCFTNPYLCTGTAVYRAISKFQGSVSNSRDSEQLCHVMRGVLCCGRAIVRRKAAR
jgi:hypothetical protein